jgi:hypothetical protein
LETMLGLEAEVKAMVALAKVELDRLGKVI